MEIHTYDIHTMTETEIDQEIMELVTLMKAGKITPSKARRLSDLRTAAQRISYVRSGKNFLD